MAGIGTYVNGWTDLAPSGDSRIIYVSASGDNAYDGLSPVWTSGTNGPKRTIRGYYQGTVSNAVISPTTTLISSADAQQSTNYVGKTLTWRSGGLNGTTAEISGYSVNSGEVRLVISPAMTGVPASGDIFSVYHNEGAYALLRNGYPDWLCLQCGDTFFENVINSAITWENSGRSITEPMVMTSYRMDGATVVYHEGTRPRLDRTSIVSYNNTSGINTAHLAFMNIESIGYGTTSGNGFQWSGRMLNILIEGCLFRDWNIIGDFAAGNKFATAGMDEVTNFIFRRNVCYDGVGMGVMFSNHNQLLIEDNFFDRNGVLGGTHNTLHNIYTQKIRNLICRNNILARGSNFGLKMSADFLAGNNHGDYSDYLVEDNLFYNNGISNDWSGRLIASPTTKVVIQDNTSASGSITSYLSPSGDTNIPLVGTVASGTYSNISTTNGTFHVINASGNVIDIVYGVNMWTGDGIGGSLDRDGTVSNAVTSPTTTLIPSADIQQENGYYGFTTVLQFMSGALSGQRYPISSYSVVSSEARFTFDTAMSGVPASGDKFRVHAKEKFDSGRAATGVVIAAYLQGSGDEMKVKAFNFTTDTWDIIGTLTGADDTTVVTQTLTLTTDHTGPSDEVHEGRVYIRLVNDSTTPSILGVDRLVITGGNAYTHKDGIIRDNVMTMAGRTWSVPTAEYNSAINAGQDLQGWLLSGDTVDWDGNLLVHMPIRAINSQPLAWGSNQTNITVRNTVVYNWANYLHISDTGVPDTSGELDYLNLNRLSGITVSNTELTYPSGTNIYGYLDPTRSVATYNSGVLGATVVENTGIADDYAIDFLVAARDQLSRTNWNTSYTANAVNDWIRAGFTSVNSSIPITPEIELSPTSFSGAGQTITASVTLLNRPDYAGHPKISGLTTITPKIVCSRVPSGVFPFFVQVSACETTSDAGNTYRDLDYRWDFGDSSGTETMTDHWNGKTVNLNDSQMGPEAGYLYRNPGNYTITLTVKGKDENGDIITASTTSLMTLGQYYIFMGQATGGNYTLTVNGETTSTIAYNASPSTILSALHALASLDATNCRMTYEGCIEFFGNLAGTIITFTGNFSGLTGATGTPQFRIENVSGTSSNVTVSNMTGWTIQYFDSTAGGGGDGSIGSPKNSTADLDSFFSGGDNRVAYLKRGSTFASLTLDWDRYSGLRMLDYGSGAKPILSGISINWELSYGSAGFPTGRLMGDVVFSNITMSRSSLGNVFFAYVGYNGDPNYPYARFRDIVVDSIDYTCTGSGGDARFASIQANTGLGMTTSNFHIWNTNLIMGDTTKSNLFTNADQWFCFIGGSIAEGNGDLSQDHHIYSNTPMHTCFRYISFQDGWDIGAGESMAFCINWNAHTDATLTQYHLIDGCDLTGTHNGLDISNSDNGDHTPLGNFTDVIVQHNRFHVGQVGSQLIPFSASNCSTIVIRYNDFFGLHKYMGQFGTLEFSIYYNRCHNTGWYFYDHDYMYFSYNLMVISGYSDTFRGHCMKLDDTYGGAYATAQSWGDNCVGNIYYSPEANSNAGTPIHTASGWISFATWQGHGNDVGGQNTDPLWYAPSGGQFIKDPTVAVNWPYGFTSLESSINDGSSWQSYVDNSGLSVGSYLNNYDTILFRGVTDSTSSNVNIYFESSAASLDTGTESGSVQLTYSGSGVAENSGLNYFISVGGLYYYIQTGFN